ncbi:hypothetical protein M885DRAFT_519584 [Pelagophyceae sp. CCMP2097]|nr:hypothetical protein M885DRAFT_519584 [Pelagophyceae sp. CCMP2097]
METTRQHVSALRQLPRAQHLGAARRRCGAGKGADPGCKTRDITPDAKPGTCPGSATRFAHPGLANRVNRILGVPQGCSPWVVPWLQFLDLGAHPKTLPNRVAQPGCPGRTGLLLLPDPSCPTRLARPGCYPGGTDSPSRAAHRRAAHRRPRRVHRASADSVLHRWRRSPNRVRRPDRSRDGFGFALQPAGWVRQVRAF